MVLKKLGAWYTILIGFSMLGLWAMLLSTGQMPELTTQTAYAVLHLITEAITAILLLIGGFGTLFGKRIGRKLYPVSLGMLLYSVLSAAGYYLQSNNMVMVIMFLAFAVISALLIFHGYQKKSDAEFIEKVSQYCELP